MPAETARPSHLRTPAAGECRTAAAQLPRLDKRVPGATLTHVPAADPSVRPILDDALLGRLRTALQSLP